jgi:hypothetical protein
MTLTEHDRTMIARARDRGNVMVAHHGATVIATLIAWKPHRRARNDHEPERRRNIARVEYLSGRRATVPCGDVK